VRHAKRQELTDGQAHDYGVLYPGGTTFRLRGIYGILFGGSEQASPYIRDATRIWTLDPRAVVTRDGLIIYDPRRQPVPAWVSAWLAEHAEWPAIATEAPR
jgi:hypothetical protein